MAAEEHKRAAAQAALELVGNGMTLGLGTGSTARHFVDGVAGRVRDGTLHAVKCVATSQATADQATSAGLQLIDLPASGVDLAVDGMDELAPDLSAIKGLGGALLREKIVAASATTFVLIGDESKLVSRLGEKTPVPVEVVRFGLARTLALLQRLGAHVEVREVDGRRFVTDNGNVVADCRFEPGFDGHELHAALRSVPGVVEHGLFMGIADLALVSGPSGVRRLERDDAKTDRRA